MRRFAFASFAVVAAVRFAFAADPSISAKVSANDMTLNSSITLILEVHGVDNVGGTPSLALPDFQVQPAGQTSSFQWINGQTSSLITFNYVLTPTKTGNLVIPSLTLGINGKNLTTQPITVTVRDDSSSGSAAASMPGEPANKNVQVPAEGLKPLFMTATVDAEKVYVGQQVLLKVQFLRRPDVRLTSQARYSEPDTTGFLVEPLQQQQYNTTINGARFDVTEIPYALFPTSDGEFAIGSAQIEMAVQGQSNPFDPDSFFQSFFGRSEVVHLKTRAIPIRVRALPANKPINFSGAVGRFKMTAQVDNNAPEVGKPLNLILTVEGVGNVKALKEPFLPELRGFRRYETISNSKVAKEGRFLSGSKEFKILLIPQVSGKLTVPAASFSYFNPAKGEYETITTPEITLDVKQGALNTADDNFGTVATAPGRAAEGIQVMEKDIRFLKTGRVRPAHPPLFKRGFFYLFNILPPLFALVALLTRVQSRRRTEFASEYRLKGAFRTAKKALSAAAKKSSSLDIPAFYGAVHAALAGFLADKLSLSAAGLLWDDVERLLTEKNIDPDLRANVRDIFESADMARFATSSFTDQSRDEFLARTETALKQLNEVL